MSDKQFDKTKIAEKRKILENVAVQLKAEFFGLDEIIDKVIKSISAWYIFPELITRPVIINLWGMTGVGKTQLVRRLVSLLEFQEAFVEVQMDGGSMKSSYDASTISKLLSQSSIEEGEPGILLLDEIQRFRTVDENGADVKLERFQDVWTLLSDGKFSADASMFFEIEMMIAYQDYQKDWVSIQEPAEEDKNKPKKPRKFKLSPYDAKSLKKTLRLHESVQEIMLWDSARMEEELAKIRSSRTTWEIDYTKLVIFVSGNLDRAFLGSRSTDDCDTDADFYHEETKKISSMHIKSSLRERFRPEQISRLGNNHIIYPSMNKASYQRLIKTSVQKYIDEMTKASKIEFSVGEDVLQEIYDNSVFPTQGTRPVFSSVHMIFSSLLANVTFWAIEHDYKQVELAMDTDRKAIVATPFFSRESKVQNHHSTRFPIELEMNEKKAKAGIDFKTLVAVHEAGHAVAYAVLKGAAPKEVKINVAAFTGGYMLPGSTTQIVTREDYRDNMVISLAGLVTEEIVFGSDHRSNGSTSDISNATTIAHSYVRNLGFDQYVGFVAGPNGPATTWMTSLDATNNVIEGILKEERERTHTLITENMTFIRRLVSEMLSGVTTITQERFIEIGKELGFDLKVTQNEYPFHEMWTKSLEK